MIHVFQLTSEGCGQACVAMILGVSFDEACALVGHPHRTRTKELRAVLTAHGYDSPLRMRRLRSGEDWPDLALARIRDGTRIHWVVLAFGAMFDPAYGWSKSNPVRSWPDQGPDRITSVLPLTRRSDE